MRNSTARYAWFLVSLALVGLVLLLAPVAVVNAEGSPQAGACSGYYYTVLTGDTWSIISRRVGVTVYLLKLANPQAVRQSNWVLDGERLCVPSAEATPQATATPVPAQGGGYWYQVVRGDTWNTVSRATGVSVADLWAANPKAVNSLQWLYVGQRLWVPGPGDATPVVTTEAAAQPTAVLPEAGTTVTATAVMTPAAAPGVAVTITVEAVLTPPAAEATPALTAAAPPPTATSVVSPLATPTMAPAGEATALPAPPIPADCPATLDDYGEVLAAYLNKAANTPETLQTWLVACRALALDEQGVTVAPITGAKTADVVVTVADPLAGSTDLWLPRGRLLVYHQGAQGYSLAHELEGVGRLKLLTAADINADKQPDLAFTETSCGAHTCFATLSVISWDGKKYEDWIAGEPTIAGPEYTFEDVSAEGQGAEIIVHGGVIGSVGAGPQRAWTETYVSPKGAAYERLSQVYDPSPCLYHKILDANAAFDAWSLDGFDPAIELYAAALAEKAPAACGEIKDEIATLQDFARFRLIVAHVAAGSSEDAPALVTQIKHAGLRAAANAFLVSYSANSSVIQACRDTTKVAESDKTTWQFLADWGYANPSFTAGELCPLS